MEMKKVTDPAFRVYGKVVDGYDCGPLLEAMEKTPLPEDVIYVPSVEELEALPVCKKMEENLYGQLPIQVGYCNGHNRKLNALEYHRTSEINVAVTDFMLVLGHVWEIKDNTYRVEDARVFFVPRGTAIEMYQTTLHLSPCRVCDEGFKGVVILPRGTNTPLESKGEAVEPEGSLLLQKNKWVIAHPEREPLIRQGAHPGLLGENKELKY